MCQVIGNTGVIQGVILAVLFPQSIGGLVRNYGAASLGSREEWLVYLQSLITKGKLATVKRLEC